jgi:TetR/AcrR family tetracycline transcriptional repressor
MARRTRRVSREDLVDAAMRIIEQDGIERLSMRKLAAELGVAITSIYWHVGNREALLDALVEREIADVGSIRPSGETPAARLVSVARALRRKLLARPHVIGLVHERGLTPLMFVPVQAALARELQAAGLGPKRSALAVRSIQSHVIGSVVLSRWEDRSPPVPAAAEERRRAQLLAASVRPEVADHLGVAPAGLDRGELFEVSTRALVDGLLAEDDTRRRH